jgi:putative colanic acid biosynthesis UDP-glucose lipid carrier transferase
LSSKLKLLRTTSVHNASQNQSARTWQHITKNGIIRSFVASRKKYLFFKRGFDLLFSLLVILLVLSWLTPIVALIIKLDSRGPVFFRQQRIGRKGNSFSCLKFRTMHPNEMADEQPATETDDRITKVGRVLRKINLDELPQFFNILIGQMSVVGPRPHMVSDCIRFSFVIPSYQFRHLMRPGITGWAQVNGFHGVIRDYESIIIRYYWDAQYVRKAGFVLDVKIIASTLLRGIDNVASVLFKPVHDTKTIELNRDQN